MAVTRRTVRLEIGRIAFDGIDPGDRGRFERAFARACEAGLRAAEPRGRLRERSVVEAPLTRRSSPEALAEALAASILRLVCER